jgi:16S rRNA C967 or C1407 C5-methylase (RsmB/RsmF family)/NOL1/NOP2/fmu family ribosome biogenesis protein
MPLGASLLTLPLSFKERISQQLAQKAEAEAFFQSLLAPPPTSLRLNPAKPFPIPENWENIPWCKEGRYLPHRPSFTLDPIFHAGGYYVQEASSMILAAFTSFKEPVKALDLCAAPGGKSTLLAALLPPGSLIWSNELVPARASILKENCIRWGYPGHIVTQNQAEELSVCADFFDYILVDAPCSGEGLWRKEPTAAALHWNPELLTQCVARQRQILKAALPLLKVGGTLVYSSCTFNPAENEENIDWLLKEYPSILEPKLISLNREWGWRPLGGEMETSWGWSAWPHRVKGEGFFFALLTKTGDMNNGAIKKNQRRSASAKNKAVYQKISGRYKNIIPQGWLKLPNQELYQKDNLIFAFSPEETELPRGPRYLKVGAYLGEIKGSDFIPAHDFALSILRGEDIPQTPLGYEQALAYLKKEEVHCSAPLGHSLATYNGLPLGWINALERRINNKLPASWRIRKAVADF